MLTFGTAIGDRFGLLFAFSYGRMSPTQPRALAVFLASIGFVAVAFVPSLKYPANPPAIGNPATIGIRTGAYFLMVAISIAATVLCLQFSRRLTRRFGLWNGSLLVRPSLWFWSACLPACFP